MRRLSTLLLIPIFLCGCPEPRDPRPVAKISADDPQVVADTIRKELSSHEYDRRLIREGPAVDDYGQYQDVGPEILWEVVSPYANLMEDMGKSGQNDSAEVMCKGILLGLRGYLDWPEKGESVGYYGDPAFAAACDVIVMYRNAVPDCPPGVFSDEWWKDYEATSSMKAEIDKFNTRLKQIREDNAAATDDMLWLNHAEWARRLRWAGLEDNAALYKQAQPNLVRDADAMLPPEGR